VLSGNFSYWLVKRKGLKVSEEMPTDQDNGAPEAGGSPPALKGRRSFSRIRRELTDDELGSSGVQKILMDDVDRLESEKSEINPYIEGFHKLDKENAVLKEKVKLRISSDITFGGFLTIGSAAVGYSPVLAAVPNASSIVLWGGIILLLAGIASKVILK
jgi:hypothetical protein